MKYIHKYTKLGKIVVKGNGLEVDCAVTVTRMSPRGGCVDQVIEYEMYNLTHDHVGGMQPLIDAALAKGKALADAYIAARKAGAVPEPRDFTSRTKIFACGEYTAVDRRSFEVYVQDFHDPSLRRLTIASAAGTPTEVHLVLQTGDLKPFLEAMSELQATPFSPRIVDGEAA